MDSDDKIGGEIVVACVMSVRSRRIRNGEVGESRIEYKGIIIDE